MERMAEDSNYQVSPEMDMLINNKEDGYEYRKRRHPEWKDNYTLYRDKVQVNRLVQRQSVHVPMMKQTVRTLLKDVDDMPVLYFENLDNDKQAEVFQNEYWKWTADMNNMELLDIVDKKQVFLFGRSFDQWQIADGMIKMDIIDPMDMEVSRYIDPTDLHSSRFLIHNHIYVPLAVLEADEKLDKQAIRRLKTWYATAQGLIKVATNQKMAVDKNEKMSEMGIDDIESPVLGETYVELSLHFVYRENEKGADGKKMDEQLFLYMEADDREILLKTPLEEYIGETSDNFWRNHFPYESWADDLERQDFWSDGVADTVRTPNQVLDSWFSQLVENRTLRNFGMHYYDSTIEGFAPSSFNPVPWGWYGMPGDPNKIVKKVDIPELSESLDEMQFVIGMTEKATGATATQQGNVQERNITLGEVQLALGEAKERIKGMSKFYTPAWKRRGRMFLKLIEAGADRLDAVKIYKKGRNSDEVFERTIAPKDWMTKSGYLTRVWSQEEKDANDTNMLQKLNASLTLIPGNDKLLEIYQRKLLEFSNLTPDEINEVMEVERAKREAMAMQIQQGGQDGGLLGQPNPGQPQIGAGQPMQPPNPVQ